MAPSWPTCHSRRVTSWYPGDTHGDRDGELLIHGDDNPPTRPRRLLAAVAAGLAAGVLIGTQVDDWWPAAGTSHLESALTAGSLAAAGDATDRLRFRVGVFNAGEVTVRVQVTGVVGRKTPVTRTTAVVVAPGNRASLAFSLPLECDEPSTPVVTALRMRAGSTGARGEYVVELAEPATALADAHRRECATTTVLSRRELGGLWHLEEAGGKWADLAQVTLMRFTADGRFAFDPEGRLFQDGGQGFFGTFRLRGARLYLESKGGYACPHGYSEAWTTTLLADDLLKLDLVDSDPGYCHAPPGEWQILRRLVPENRLPPDRPAGHRNQ